MRRVIPASLVLFLLAGALPAQRRGRGVSQEALPPLAGSPHEQKILETIDEIFRSGALYANVPAADGRLLRILAEAVNAKRIIEIGTSTGISGLWFCLALEKTGGVLTTFELDAGRAATARKHFEKAGVSSRVKLIEGDAHRNIRQLKEPVDLVFIDAEKDGYVDYVNTLLPLVRPGGLILAHNTGMVPEYMQAVGKNASLETVVYSSGGGLAVTLKKR